VNSALAEGKLYERIAKCLGLQAEAKVELEVIIAALERKMSSNTILSLGCFGSVSNICEVCYGETKA